MRIAIHRRPFSRTLFRVAAVVLVGAACSDVAGGDHPGTDPRVGANLLPTTGIPTTAADIRGTITAVQTGVDTRPTGGGGPPGGSVSCPPDCGASGPPLQAVLIEGSLAAPAATTRATSPCSGRRGCCARPHPVQSRLRSPI